MNFVLDASVALKWYKRESDTDQALEIYDQIKQHSHFTAVPFLLYLEIASALITRHKSPASVVKEVLADLHDLPFEPAPYNQSLGQMAISLASKHSLTVYDAIYLAIAKATNIKLLTADKKIIKSAPKDCITIKDLT